MNKPDVLQQIENAHVEFERSLEGLGEEVLSRLPVIGEWTAKDIMAHVVAWEAEAVTAIAQLPTGARPRYAGLAENALDRLNAKWHAENRDRPLDRVRADFEGVHKQMLRRAQALSDKDLFTPGQFKWRSGGTLAEWILGDGCEHIREHAKQILEWRARTGK